MKTKLLPILLILLVILNGFLIFMLIQKPHQKRQNNQQRNFLTEQLKFSDIQKKTFKNLDKIHRGFMMNIEESIKDNKDVLFNSFSKKDVNVDSITAVIGVLEAKKEAELFRFFSKVRVLCTKEQTKNFDSIIKEALRGGVKRPPRRDAREEYMEGDRRMPPPR